MMKSINEDTNNIIRDVKGQVTIFIILALIIVVSMIILFLLLRNPLTPSEELENPEVYIDSCVKESAKEAIDLISSNGGDIKPAASIMYNGDNITYLCYNANYYKPCINQRPMLIEHIEDEIKIYIEPKVRSCFDSLKEELENKGYVASIGNPSIQVSVISRQVAIDIKNNVRITKKEKTQEFRDFNVNFITPIYELSEIAMEIVNQESQYCNFENLGFMIIYPDYDIRKERIADSIIYTLKDVNTNEDFKFAVRSCAMPAGL